LFGEFLVYTPDRVVDEETVGLEIELYRKMKLKKERRWKNIRFLYKAKSTMRGYWEGKESGRDVGWLESQKEEDEELKKKILNGLDKRSNKSRHGLPILSTLSL
jgi:hypothetical protein